MLKKKYILQIKKIALGLIPFLVILIIWWVFYYFNQDLKWLVPSPLETIRSFFNFIGDGTFLRLIYESMLNLIPAFIFAVICAIALGTLIGISRNAQSIFYPFLSAIYPIPSLVWLPFIILILGFTREAIWSVIFISSFTKMIYNSISGIQNVDINYILAAKNLGFKKSKIILNVILPCAFPQILTGLRVSFGSAWRSLIGAEMLVMTLGGLGKFIWISQWYYDFDKVIAGILVISLISIFVEEIVFKKLERNTLLKWGNIRDDHNF